MDDEWTTDGRTTEGRMEMASVASTSAYWAPCPRTTNHTTNYENAFHGEDQNTNEIKIHLSLESNVYKTITLAKYEIGYLKEKRRVESSFPDETVCSAKFCCLRLPRRSSKSFQGNHSLNLAILILYSGEVLKGCLTVLLPTIKKMFSLSLSTGTTPDVLKVAIL